MNSGCLDQKNLKTENNHPVLNDVAAINLIINVDNRTTTSLNGKWPAIVDLFETGFYDYRYQENKWGFFDNYKPKNKSERVEYDFDTSQKLNVPGDWNSQYERLFFYEGTVWYKKSFDYKKKENKRIFVYIGAANYQTIVYLNGKKLGIHEGGFTPFNFEITDLIKEKDNYLVLKVDNKRKREAVPTVNTDWWNYGGITREVLLVEVSDTFIRDYFIQLKKGSLNTIAGWVQLDGSKKQQSITIEIPEAKIVNTVRTDDNGLAKFQFDAELDLWSPENPKLYDVVIKSETDTLKDTIGFRTIETKSSKILLNGKPVFLRGICIHEQKPNAPGRAYGPEDAETLLGWAKEMNCNFVRLAHYPHNEHMVRAADKMGLLVWSEIPVYWTITWQNKDTLNNALNQLTEMITRDKNRASVILWSMANETPPSDARNKFLLALHDRARQLDDTRLITAAMEKTYHEAEFTPVLNDPFGQHVDVLGCNEYIGWYYKKIEDCVKYNWKSIYDKPLIISEFGAGAKAGFHADKYTMWSEELQEYLYIEQVKMLENIDILAGVSPWILMDFRSPKRMLPEVQDYWNRKGLISPDGKKKKAFYIMQKFYKKIKDAQK
ncbi:MAG: beta-glucuronidase [Planctomycetes bacterium]|nr:beta-glucuronidase [Planctomycetota bacterium]